MIDLPVIPIERLTRRLAECPQEFLAEPWSGPKDGDGLVRVAAVVSDLLTDLGLNDRLNPSEIKTWRPGKEPKRNRLRLVLVACWLCHDDDLVRAGCFGKAVKAWLHNGLAPLAGRVSAELFVTDPDRREELARLLLQALDLVPQGETPAQAADRLKSLDSVERDQVIRETRSQLERARKLRAAMESKRAQAAAARCTSE